MQTEEPLAFAAGVLKSWARTVDRAGRMAPAHEASTGRIGYWIKQLDPELFANATDEQKVQAAGALMRAHYTRLAYLKAKKDRLTKEAAAEESGGDGDAAPA